MATQMLKSVFEFKDFRVYLQHFYEFQKLTRPGYSYREFAVSAGLKSPNYLKLITGGKKRLTVTNIHQVARALKLNGSEHDYFETLVLWNQSKNKNEELFYKNRLSTLKIKKPE